ncbi:bifunctional adenosylcobinamide kinase/adenosylcobinamide-phosphate guanylyltransferase [Roseobacteraceae bacterium S113]
MEKSILITGGARSGKSLFAERLALAHGGDAIYIATAEAHDGEMEARIAAHQARRDARWHNLHAPLELARALRESDDGTTPRLVDCLTLWLTNLMLGDRDWHAALSELVEATAAVEAPVIFVTNEVGLGIVPENALARAFRDAAGRVNQEMGAACKAVHLVVAGQPLQIKPPR